MVGSICPCPRRRWRRDRLEHLLLPPGSGDVSQMDDRAHDGVPLVATVVTAQDDFSELADQWDALVADCRSATPFQTHAWLESWWRAYGSPGRLRVVLLHAGEDLVAAAPLYLSRRFPLRTLLPIGAGVSDFCDVLVADSHDVDVRPALTKALARVSHWDAMDFPEVRPGAAVGALADRWPGTSASLLASTCLELPVEDMSDLLTRLPRPTAKVIRRKLRKIDDVGVDARRVSRERVPEALRTFFQLHEEQWTGRGVTAEHVRPRFVEFLNHAMPLMVEREQADLIEYEVDGTVLGMRLNVVSGSMLGAYLSGISPALRERLDVATLMLRYDQSLARTRGQSVLSLLRGQEDYKMRWRPNTVTNERIVLCRPGSLLGQGYLLACRARGQALPWLRRHAPWLRHLRDRLRRTGSI